jgi:DNA modification methylase
LAKDSSKLHPALADYILQFKKRGDNPEPIRAGISEKYGNPEGWITSEEWIEWAAPVWHRHTKDNPDGIRETDTLNVSCAREAEDEKHLCPLQLSVIERVVKLWSNPGDIVFSPFMGIGSEGYQSLMLNRRFIGIELKRSYYDQAQRYLERALQERHTTTLFEDVSSC